MSDDLKVGATGNTGQGVGQVDGAANEQKRTELEQKQLTEGLAGKKEKSAEQEETLTVTVENGESIAKLAKKYGVSVKEIMDLNEKQIKYFKNAKDCDDTKKYAGFLVGARIKLPANANMKAVEENLKTTVEAERKKYEESMKKLDKELCDDRTQSYRVMDENFRKEHNIRTKSEYEAGNTAPEAPETPTDPKTPKEPVKSEDKELSDEEFREKYPYIARPKEDTQAYEPPKFEPPKFPGAELPKEEEIQVPLRPKDEAETPECRCDQKMKQKHLKLQKHQRHLKLLRKKRNLQIQKINIMESKFRYVHQTIRRRMNRLSLRLHSSLEIQLLKSQTLQKLKLRKECHLSKKYLTKQRKIVKLTSLGGNSGNKYKKIPPFIIGGIFYTSFIP